MPNAFDFYPRSPSNRTLFVVGACFVAIAIVLSVLMVEKSEGKLDNLVRVDITMSNIGDGLPARSDVKFRGVLVGSVFDVTPSRNGQPNVVHVDLTPAYAGGIPDTVTARVIPSNIFAVSAIQLVDKGEAGKSLHTGSVVKEDTTLPTVLFQNVLARLRELLAAGGRKPDPNSIGVLATVGEATQGRGHKLTDAGHDLNEILTQLNAVVSTHDTGPSTITALNAAADGLRTSAPELFDALQRSIKPMRTLAEKRRQLTDFLSGGLNTAKTLGDAFDHQTDRLITITTQLAPALGVLADHADQFHGLSTRMQILANKFYDEAWNPDTNLLTAKIVLGFTPLRRYVRADCPRYGGVAGPSCDTAPDVPTAPDLFPSLASQGVPPPPGATENRPNVTPPRHSMPGDPQGPPAPQPTPRQLHSAPTPLTGMYFQSALIGGNVESVGSRQEKEQLSRIIGGKATAVTVLLLGPVVRGATVRITPEPAGGR